MPYNASEEIDSTTEIYQVGIHTYIHMLLTFIYTNVLHLIAYTSWFTSQYGVLCIDD